MSLVTNSLTATRHTIDESNEQIVLFNGLDRPRYYSPVLGTAGYLGISDWADYSFKPVGGAVGTGGSLVNGFYSIYVVPVNGDITAGGFPIQGNATSPSVPVEVTAGTNDGDISFTVPVHPQMRTNLASLATATGTTTLEDTDQTWSVNEWIGFTVLNVETGLTSIISGNTSDTLSFPDDIDTDTIGDRYQILSSEVTARFVYASTDAVAGNAVVGSFYFVGVINDNSTTTYNLTELIAAGEIFTGDNFAPPNAFTCHVNGDVVYAGGGIKIEGAAGNTAEWNSTVENLDATIQPVAVAEQDDDWTGADTSKIMRYTVTAGDEFTALYVGSYVTITSSASAGNDLAAVRVTGVGPAMEWFEVLNNNGVDDAADAVMQIAMTPNVIVGTGTAFSEGMVDAQFEFTNDNTGSHRISWVDPVAQIMGIAALYAGNNVATTLDYRVRSDYDLYYSDFKNPHKYRSVNLIEIGDEIKGLYALGRSMIVFCSGSVWRHNMLEPGAAPQLISDEVFFDATHSICSNGQLIMFYDGEGLSITDGVTLQSVTALKGREYMNNVNKELAIQIQGIYNPKDRRFEFTMPMGTETNNNYGIYITEDSFNNVPSSRVDANALFSGYENGRFKIYHGTSGNLSGGAGAVWTHDGVTDGLTGAGFSSTITGIASQVVTVQATETIAWGVGDTVLFYPAGSGNYRQAMIESIVDNTAFNYSLTFASDYDLTLFAVDDLCLFGMIPFDYGIKWTDFTSPQYLKRFRELQVDLYGMTGSFSVDHYLDLNETPVHNETKVVVATDSKLVYRFRKGQGYTYGFRMRGYSSTEFKINSFERIFSVKS